MSEIEKLIEKEARVAAGTLCVAASRLNPKSGILNLDSAIAVAIKDVARRVADAAVQGERERCLKLVNDFTGYSRNEAAQKRDADIAAIWNGQADSFEKAAAAIRKGTPE